MPRINNIGLTVRSRGFDLLRDKEKAEGRKISVDSLASQSKISRAIFRQYFDTPNADVTNTSVRVAADVARVLGVPIGELLFVEVNDGDKH
jgi:hypothetical protein